MVLLLYFHAPLQSYGYSSKHLLRDCGREPSKSAVVGLLSAAVGLNRQTEGRCGFTRSQLIALRMAVRIDHPGVVVTDFHTAQNILKVDESNVSRVRPEKGGPAFCDKDTSLTHRRYLSDAAFTVGLEADRSLLEALADAIRRPKWFLYLGRKSCPTPPAPWLLAGLREGSLLNVISEHPWQRHLAKKKPKTLEVVFDSDKPTDELRQDVPLTDFMGYGYRYVAHSHVPLTRT
jgi:CRISPR system Cascade subunit CasD